MPLPKYSNEPNFVGYPYYYILNGHTCQCHTCADESLQDGQSVEPSINWENKNLYCETCPEQIECAYGAYGEEEAESEEPSEEDESEEVATLSNGSLEAETKFLFSLFMGAMTFLD